MGHWLGNDPALRKSDLRHESTRAHARFVTQLTPVSLCDGKPAHPENGSGRSAVRIFHSGMGCVRFRCAGPQILTLPVKYMMHHGVVCMAIRTSVCLVCPEDENLTEPILACPARCPAPIL